MLNCVMNYVYNMMMLQRLTSRSLGRAGGLYFLVLCRMTLFQDPSLSWRTLALEWRGGWATTWPGLDWRQLELRGWKKSARPPLGQGSNTAAD